MKRSEVRDFLEDGILLLTDVSYGSGRLSEFNSDRSQSYPMAWIESLRVSTSLKQIPYDTWAIRIHISKQDTPDSVEGQYETIVDQSDELAQELIRYYDQVIADHQLITLGSITRDPFIKKHADCLTGVILAFTLTAPDKTNLC